MCEFWIWASFVGAFFIMRDSQFKWQRRWFVSVPIKPVPILETGLESEKELWFWEDQDKKISLDYGCFQTPCSSAAE